MKGVCYDAFNRGSNDLRYEESSQVDGHTMVSFSRLLDAGDRVNDKVISTTEPTYIIWAMGQIVDKYPIKHEFRLKGIYIVTLFH